MVESFFDKVFKHKIFDAPEILRPQVVILALLFLPYSFLPPGWPAGILCLAIGLVYMDLCFGLTFDGFIRFSRYRLSQKHPTFDKIVSTTMIASCFLGFLPVALLLKSYSFVVSPDENEHRKPFYDSPFIVPLVQAIIILTAYVVSYLKFGF